MENAVRLPHQLWPFIWHFLKPYKLFIFLFSFFAMATGLWGPINSILMKQIVDILGTHPAGSVGTLVIWPAIFLVINFESHNLCWRGMGYLNYKFQPVIKNQIISETFAFTHQHSYQFFQDNLAGRIANHITTLSDNIERIVHDISRHVLRCIVLLVIAFITMYRVHPTFSCILFLWFFVFAFIRLKMSKRLMTLSEAHAASESIVSGQLVDSITNANTVRIFARRLYEISYIQKALNLAKEVFRKKELFSIKVDLLQGFSLSMMLACMFYYLIQLRATNSVTPGDFALIFTLNIEVGFMTWWTLEQVDELNKAIGKCNQTLSRLFTPLEVQDKEDARELSVTKGQIAFSKVHFHYKGTELLFQNKSVTIEAGQKVGLVGYSGSGKSTFVNLILRLYDIQEGSIAIDGQDIREVTQDSLRSHIAMIPQDPSLFHRSIMENIRYGRVTASDSEVIEAAKRAHAHEFINKLSQGYESLVGERGIKLSGGQRQRIAIARAILKNAPILILDEATSQLDSLTEIDIQESLWKLMQGKTTVVIAHRLSTLQHMDRILVFDQGKICEDGSHKVLLDANCLYRTLWDSQVGGFLPMKKMDMENRTSVD